METISSMIDFNRLSIVFLEQVYRCENCHNPNMDLKIDESLSLLYEAQLALSIIIIGSCMRLWDSNLPGKERNDRTLKAARLLVNSDT